MADRSTRLIAIEEMLGHARCPRCGGGVDRVAPYALLPAVQAWLTCSRCDHAWLVRVP
jgi:hypothetical protein